MPTRLFVNAAQVVTCAGPARARRGEELRDAGVLSGAAVAVEGARIAAVGNEDALRRTYSDAEVIDCGRGVLLPGLVDSHTHAIFGKARFEEQEMRAAGYDYMDIARRGGGIHASVRDLRSRSEDELVALALPRLRRLASYGATTVEVKSGYGLTLDDELKSLRAIQRLQGLLPLRLVPTFLGAHEIPLEWRGTPEGRADYVDLIVKEMIPRVVEGGLAQFADVFCEPGVFTLEETRAVLSAARAAGLRLKLHADELRPSGGAELAAQLGATSADHLAAISEPGVRALAASATVATMLPGTMLFLGKERQAPARALIDGGAAVALATDFNPGTSPTPNFPLILALAVSQLHLSVSEAVIAATVNGAAALALAEETGQLAPGYSADLALFDIEDVRELPYWYGDRRCRATWVRGVPCAA
ncbi:MAG: imidazolonepropionase [Gemmatimonadetes bacterium]|jgi:imidazolonepropionase|nr:imidazolonepropionase [Gemmatimonadota bacterium]MCC7322643.1 imidazolonepropionase [Gemmatimonadaceae bacterium]MBK6455615.1 imidazolonepropionase [Gemmatimonadota bacterium]MBK6841788.1 imidazolonepropionase [Gemmatimonadota bacterium]MBK7835490.1 imidazolonepropionase [Gemmatimonadota bacterium]